MNREKKIYKAILEEFSPEFLEVKNNSHIHKGHSGYKTSEDTHFSIIIKCEKLKKLKRLDAHKAINRLLIEEFQNGLHALEINII